MLMQTRQASLPSGRLLHRMYQTTRCFGHMEKLLNVQKLERYSKDVFIKILKTYAAISNAHLSRVWKRVKLSGSCLATFNGFVSTQFSDILMSYQWSDIFLTK